MENGGIMFENPYETRDICRTYLRKPIYIMIIELMLIKTNQWNIAETTESHIRSPKITYESFKKWPSTL